MKPKITSSEEFIVRLQIKNDEMKEWVSINKKKLDRVVNKLLEDLNKTEKLLKD